MPVLVGLTGGIASGKSTVSAMLRERGVQVIDADVLAREVVAPGTEGFAAIRSRFGDDVVAADGRLDRAELGERVFADPEARTALESITHPRIAARMMAEAAEAGASGRAWVVYDAALLVERGYHESFPRLIVVAVDPQTQLDRLIARDGIDEAAARARVAAQLPLANKVAVADYVIDNGGSIEETRAQVAAVVDELIEEFGSPRAGAS